MNATATTPVPQRTDDQTFTLYDVSWEAFIAISDALGEQPIRINYDQGVLEFITTSHRHERIKKLLAKLVEALIEELDLPVVSGGMLTLRKEEFQRGMEPDDCWWLANAERMIGRDYDAAVDPPPDLAVEIDISRLLARRLGILAALGVPEVWTSNGEEVRALRRTAKGQYEPTDRSDAFPFLALGELARFLRRHGDVNETQIIREFRGWVRERIAANWK